MDTATAKNWTGPRSQLTAMAQDRDKAIARAEAAEAERDAERVANRHEKRLRLEMVAHVESAEADVASYKMAAAECELECKALRARAAIGDDNG